jgi:hypothetical protein
MTPWWRGTEGRCPHWKQDHANGLCGELVPFIYESNAARDAWVRAGVNKVTGYNF